MPGKFITYLQNLSYPAKTRLISFVVLFILIVGGGLWINSIKTSFSGLGTEDILPESGTVLSASKYFVVEAMQKKDGKSYIYFKIENPTDNVLSFSPIDKIRLVLKEEEINPVQILNRQDQIFVKKVLNKTTEYGVMVFPEFDDKTGELIVDEMYFDQAPEHVFKESVQIDFEELKEVEELRS